MNKEDEEWKTLNLGLMYLLFEELYEKRYGTPPEWAVNNKLLWLFWYYFRGGKAYYDNRFYYMKGAKDFTEWRSFNER